ncbi:MAG: alpha/beta fold hydrolase [Bacteroidota bacterium]
MTSAKRVLRKTTIITSLLLVGLLLLIDSCIQFRMSRKEVDQFFSDKPFKGTLHQYYVGNQPISYLKVGEESKPLVVFVHGSPGSLSAFIDFMADTSLLKRAQLVTVDRPGFGTSNFGKAEPSLRKQAAAIKPLLEAHQNNRPIILVGHSLGGPVIARMAMDYPDLVDGLVFVAPSLDPELEPHEWFRAPLATPFFKWMLPRSLRASNDEIYQLKPELQKMLPLWGAIRCPSIVIQGLKDSLVPPANAEFAQRMITNAPVKLMLEESMDHFVPWSHPHLIRHAVLEMVNNQTQLLTGKSNRP